MVSLTILIELVIVDFATEHVLPGLVEVGLILHIEHNIIHHVFLGLALGHALPVDELDEILDMALKHFLEGAHHRSFFTLLLLVSVDEIIVAGCWHRPSPVKVLVTIILFSKGALMLQAKWFLMGLKAAVVSGLNLGGVGFRLLHRFVVELLLQNFLLVVKGILNALQKNQIVLADVFLFTNGDLVTLVVKDGLEDATRIQILLLSKGHCREQIL